ncbi:hypothetical protein ZIOFF_073929 [Zingiber officinale]|uniref:Uncharacterized protein n=1 Tax=Zingiber officinale TaxID=94328 RepID=A0A8J5BZC2_ZINOF|nr:hypothetical protein ZIOFF_073929 [Zingiber officinale]
MGLPTIGGVMTSGLYQALTSVVRITPYCLSLSPETSQGAIPSEHCDFLYKIRPLGPSMPPTLRDEGVALLKYPFHWNLRPGRRISSLLRASASDSLSSPRSEAFSGEPPPEGSGGGESFSSRSSSPCPSLFQIVAA